LAYFVEKEAVASHQQVKHLEVALPVK